VHDIFVPALGHAMEDCVVVEWLKQPGDHVASGEDVVSIETDKSAVELVSEAEGVLGRHRYAPGDRVPVGKVLAYVLADGETEPGDDGGRSDPDQTVPDRPVPEEPQAATQTSGGDRQRMSPRQRRLARQAGPAAGGTEDQAPSPADDRAATAAAVTKAWQSIPQFSVCRDIRAEGVRATVAAARAGGAPATVTDVLLIAFARALRATGVENDPSLGLAVATATGVAIPVVPRPASATIETVAQHRAAAVDRARRARAVPDDATAVTATVSNLGDGGVRSFTGIVPVGQTMLLTAGGIRPAACVENGSVVAGEVITMTLNLDHRAYDGTHGAAILEALAAEMQADTARTGKGNQTDA
jgi:pyruvate dehydrogenase E2 component (dihydrolipoamide acetyltransferase)